MIIGEEMKKILIIINDNNLIFKERKKLNNEYKSIINTNVISCNELLFSEDYMKENPKIVTTFLIELSKANKIDTAIIENDDLNLIVMDVIKNNPYILNLILKEDIPLNFKTCEKITESHIKNLNCYNLQEFMLEILDKYHILVESRSEILFPSNFMKGNNLSSYSSLFYKITIHLTLPFNNADEEDFKTFIKINKYLKYIHVNAVKRSDLETIVEILKKYNKKNIHILINENINDLSTIEYLKNYNKKHSKRQKIYFKICYSDSYLQENLIKQTNTNILKSCGLIIILIIGVTFSYVFYDNYHSMQKVTTIQENLKKVIEITDTESIIAKLDDEIIKEEKPLNEEVAKLLSINPEVVGWLTVNNTNIDYPTVRANNNEYYLSHNIYMENDANGWVFTDYRNDPIELNDNLIVYAHNRYYSGVMFGTLANTTKKSWYGKEENQIITYKTLNETYHYKIFSIYKIYKTNDYIATSFTSTEAKDIFFNKLKDRSIYNFNVPVNGNDKILTLSTCADENNRIVVHAVLQKD